MDRPQQTEGTVLPGTDEHYIPSPDGDTVLGCRDIAPLAARHVTVRLESPKLGLRIMLSSAESYRRKQDTVLTRTEKGTHVLSRHCKSYESAAAEPDRSLSVFRYCNCCHCRQFYLLD